MSLTGGSPALVGGRQRLEPDGRIRHEPGVAPVPAGLPPHSCRRLSGHAPPARSASHPSRAPGARPAPGARHALRPAPVHPRAPGASAPDTRKIDQQQQSEYRPARAIGPERRGRAAPRHREPELFPSISAARAPGALAASPTRGRAPRPPAPGSCRVDGDGGRPGKWRRRPPRARGGGGRGPCPGRAFGRGAH